MKYHFQQEMEAANSQRAKISKWRQESALKANRKKEGSDEP